MKHGRSLLFAAVAIWILAWFLPIDTRGSATLPSGIPGWEAFRGALDLWGSSGDPLWLKALAVASALTNFVFVGAVVSARLATRLRLLWIALLACGLLNTFWFVLNDEWRSSLRIGYYMWVASYFALAAALRAPQMEATPTRD